MSSGMLLLAGLFATGPVTAPPPESAPMPRAKTGRIAVELRFDLTPRGLTFGAGVGPEKPLPIPVAIQPASMPLEPMPLFGHSVVQPYKPYVPGELTPAGPPPEVRQMMLQAIEQMSGPVAVPIPPQVCLPSAPVQDVWAPAAMLMVRPAGMLPLGTWTRVVGPVRYKMEIKAETFVLTTTLTEEDDDGKVASVDHVLTADWYSTRNAGELVGLVTGFDIATTGKQMKRDDVSGLLGSLAAIQKQLTGKPIALTVRMSDDVLSIGDVRMPVLKDEYDELSAAFAALGGNYKPVDAASTQPVRTRVTPASGKFLKHNPQCFPNDPTFPLPRELQNPTEMPQRIGVDFNFNPPRFYGSAPPMPLPTPLPEWTKPNPWRNGGR